jgi:hypothetical protein
MYSFYDVPVRLEVYKTARLRRFLSSECATTASEFPPPCAPDREVLFVHASLHFCPTKSDDDLYLARPKIHTRSASRIPTSILTNVHVRTLIEASSKHQPTASRTMKRWRKRLQSIIHLGATSRATLSKDLSPHIKQYCAAEIQRYHCEDGFLVTLSLSAISSRGCGRRWSSTVTSSVGSQYQILRIL